MSRYLYKKIQNISPELLDFQHSGLKLTTLGSYQDKDGYILDKDGTTIGQTGPLKIPKDAVG